MKFFNVLALVVATTEALRIRQAPPQPPKEPEEQNMVDAIIKELDADKSGTISLKELLSYAHD